MRRHEHSTIQTSTKHVSYHSLCFLVPSSLMAKSTESGERKRKVISNEIKTETASLLTGGNEKKNWHMVFWCNSAHTIMRGEHTVTAVRLSQYSILLYNGVQITSEACELISLSPGPRQQSEFSHSLFTTIWTQWLWMRSKRTHTHTYKKPQNKACYNTAPSWHVDLFQISLCSRGDYWRGSH